MAPAEREGGCACVRERVSLSLSRSLSRALSLSLSLAQRRNQRRPDFGRLGITPPLERIRCRANMAHIRNTRQSRPDSGLVFQEKFWGNVPHCSIFARKRRPPQNTYRASYGAGRERPRGQWVEVNQGCVDALRIRGF